MNKKQFEANVDHISRIYEAAKDGVYKGDMKPALDGLQEIRNIACEALQKLYPAHLEEPVMPSVMPDKYEARVHAIAEEMRKSGNSKSGCNVLDIKRHVHIAVKHMADAVKGALESWGVRNGDVWEHLYNEGLIPAKEATQDGN